MPLLSRHFRPRIAIVLVISGCPLGVMSPQSQAQPLAMTPADVAERLSGVLVYQLEGDRQIHMTTCRVSTEGHSHGADPSSLYLYQEQARDDTLDQPYRQRFLRLDAIAPNQVASVSYRPVTEERWVQFCQREPDARIVTLEDFLPTHCTVTLQQKGQKFIGTTPEEGCVSNYRGAAFVKNRVILTPKGMKTYDQGFDANGNRVWGSDGTPYIFKKVAP